MYNMELVDVDVVLTVYHITNPIVTSFDWCSVWVGVRNPLFNSYRLPVYFSIIGIVDDYVEKVRLTNSDTKI